MSGRVYLFYFLSVWCHVNFYFHVKVSNEPSFPQEPRLYFIDQNFILRELVGPKTGGAWAFGAVAAGKSHVYVSSALSAFGVSGGNLPTGVRLRILFHETGELP